VHKTEVASDLPLKTAMLIDDDTGFVRLLSTFIERYCGLSVIDTASCAEEALPIAHRRRPAFILVDICMPGMSGLDAIEPLRAASPSSHIIVVSSMPAEFGVKAVQLGAAGYVEKAYIVEDLHRLISRAEPSDPIPGPATALVRHFGVARGAGTSSHDQAAYPAEVVREHVRIRPL
jgi:DNA-binding NarL/FixJ family response regulator